MGKHTPLHDIHIDANAKMVDFGGWDMPVNYGSQLDEHHAVRRDAGMFDVSHMRTLDLHGDHVAEFLRFLVSNNIDKLAGKGKGKALYSCMLNEQAGVVDDLIIYRMGDHWFRLVVNAGNADNDVAWIESWLGEYPAVRLDVRSDLAMIAVQGPNARSKTQQALTKFFDPETTDLLADLGTFSAVDLGDMFIARTGYTGEDGFEIAIKADRCGELWHALTEAGVVPCGLGARDTLRLEAGMNLHGSDMDDTTNPLESGLGWTIGWDPADRNFIGRPVLEDLRKQGVKHKLVGLVLLERGVLRGHQRVVCGPAGDGETTSGTFSPTLSKAIALARVPFTVKIGDEVKVEIRNKQLAAQVVAYPFVRNGKSCLETNHQEKNHE